MTIEGDWMKIQKLDTNIHDTKKVSELIYETDEDLFTALLGKNEEKSLEKLQNIVETGGNPYGYEHIQVAVSENTDVMGILTAFKGTDIKHNQEVKSYFHAVDFNDFLKLTLVKPIIDKMVAFADIKPDDYYLGNIAVDEDLRGEGIGSELLQRAKEDAKARCCNRILLDVLFTNRGVVPWYEGHGFSICGKKSAKKFGIDEGTFGMEYFI